MIEHIFSSRTRVKLLSIFLANQENQYFVRQLTRLLTEQINSIRRELANLKKIGFLKSRARNRKKYFYVNKNFLIIDELTNIFNKTSSSSNEVVQDLQKIGNLQMLVSTGLFMEIEAPVDLLIVGEFDKDNLSRYLKGLEKKLKHSVKYTTMSGQDFLLRKKCNDQFLMDLFKLKHNILYNTLY
ncbi:MAG: hypothetical protein A2788_02445 [Candidatus Abawacabacteria bacterium RIFCSPHIGHO2_01_FULL_46_8]|uniref:HTH arsR-type domain-containing protein n=1 Tax=Candidatus Abawacabacteria bacterium RIFCSPHIGHO2_01_FULL_46_8 TaxID=1817815 RepID=A0A1F4XM28_9BACT|nr:MAG: hypothetical protein A2788_02445 [Candidatus Abawacabacteria bacterium RIFCSPHIGHO2_01_FULL_46_8]